MEHTARIAELEKEISALQAKEEPKKPQEKNTISDNRSNKPWKWLFGWYLIIELIPELL
jgi:hypothetical protein